jgi:CxxC motif-containing protein
METLLTCVSCPKGCSLQVLQVGNAVEIKGNKCARGVEYALAEIADPRRVATTTVLVSNGYHPLLPVRSTKAVPKRMVADLVRSVGQMTVEAPVRQGQVVVADIFNTGIDIIASRDIEINTIRGCQP